MNGSYTSIAVASLCILALGGCAGQEVGWTSATASGGTPFTAGLHAGYLNLAKGEYAEGDYKDSDFFARLAQRAGRGESFDPQPVNDRLGTSAWPALPTDTVASLAGARERLMAALPAARTAAPASAARAQVAFDCWLQEQEENFQPKDIAACRSAHDAAMAELAPPAPAPRAAAPAVSPAPSRSFLVFFDWDSSVLTDGAKSVVATASRDAGQMGRITMVATGHADRSGTDMYNIDLSRRRAEAVKAELVWLGTPATEIAVEARGEAEPLVPTGDNVREAQNRRVQIVLR